MIAALALLAGAATAFGPSPLAAEDHKAEWESLTIDDAGEGWIDSAWQGSDTREGRPLRLVLVRMDLTEGEGMTLDMVMAVDCAAQTIGVKDAWFFKSQFGNQIRAPITELTMDFQDNPLSLGDIAIISQACTGSEQTK